MGQDTPRQTREGRLIEEAAKASGRSVKKLAANAGISDTRWRHIVKGWQPAPGGTMNAVSAPASTLARMAFAVGVTAEALTEAGRADAADLLSRMDPQSTGLMQPAPAAATPMSRNSDEIDMIYASQTMTAEQKLRAIRQVLALRAQVEAESGRTSRGSAGVPVQNSEDATTPSA